MLENGAFSDDGVVKAAKDFVPVLLKTDREVEGRYGGVDGYPTVLFADGGEKKQHELNDRSPAGVVKQMQEVLAKVNPEVPWETTLEAAEEKAKGRDGAPGKLRVLVFADERETSQRLLKAFRSREIISQGERVVFVKLPYAKDAAGVETYKVKQAATVVVLDDEGKTLASTTSLKDAKGVAALLQKHLKKDPKKKP